MGMLNNYKNTQLMILFDNKDLMHILIELELFYTLLHAVEQINIYECN